MQQDKIYIKSIDITVIYGQSLYDVYITGTLWDKMKYYKTLCYSRGTARRTCQ